MKQRHHGPEQIIRKLAEGDKMLNEGHDVGESCLEIGRRSQGVSALSSANFFNGVI